MPSRVGGRHALPNRILAASSSQECWHHSPCPGVHWIPCQVAPMFGSPTTAQGVVARVRTPRCGKASSIGSLLTVSQMRALTARLQVRMRLSVAYHPQTDGATETTHSTWLGRLRTTAYTYHSDWEVLRPRYEPLNISYEYA
jgi:hypothetical protein